MSMLKVARKSLFVDPAVQGAVLRRAVCYWGACLLFVGLPLIIRRTLDAPDRLFYEHLGDLWAQFWPLLICGVLMLPLMIYDLLSLTNRFAGPMIRLRGAMRRLADGHRVDPVQFRQQDFWKEFAEYFNEIAEQLEREPSGTGDARTADAAGSQRHAAS
jgi:hypothetical protein